MNRYAVAAVLSGAFFGLTGLFTRTLTGAGLSTMGILSIRCSVAALCFFCTALGDVRQLRIHKRTFSSSPPSAFSGRECSRSAIITPST